MQDVMPISQTGYDKLRDEMSKLEQEAAELRIRVAEAREQGDLKENAEFIYGRQNLGFIEGRLGEIMGKLSYSKIVDCTQVPCDKVSFGTIVTLKNLETKKKVVYQILGPYDADLDNGSISILSPIGDALIDHKVGDVVCVTVPRGDIEFEILEITGSQIQ